MTRLTTGLALGAALALMVLAGACPSSESGSRVDRARTAYQQGRLDEARELFEQALVETPGDVSALVGLVDIHLDRSEIDQAAARLAAIDALELDRRGEQLVAHARSRYYRVIYERACGDGPAQPEDPAAFEEALIALFNLEAQPAQNDELVALFAIQARRALGVSDPTRPLDPDSPEVLSAGLDQLQAALDGYRRFTQHDDRLTRVLAPSAGIQAESETIIPILERRIFDRQFDLHFASQVRPALIDAGRFDVENDAIAIHFTSPEPYPEEAPEGEALDALRQELAIALVVEELTDLAFQVRGTPRTTPQPIQLGRTPEEVLQAYAEIEVVSFDLDRSGIVTMEVRAPYGLLPRTAWRLEQYLAWLETHPTGDGSGEGSGSGGGPE